MWSPKEDKIVLWSCMVMMFFNAFFQFCLADFGMFTSLEHSVFEERSDTENKAFSLAGDTLNSLICHWKSYLVSIKLNKWAKRAPL